MADALYPKFLEALLNGEHDLNTHSIKAVPVNTTTDYSYNTAHDQLADVTTYSGVTAVAVTTPTITNGVFDCDAITFPSVVISGSKDIEAIVFYNDTATGDPLIAYYDNFTAITPNGGDVTVTPGTNLFSL